jgi:hypothetical protein
MEDWIDMLTKAGTVLSLGALGLLALVAGGGRRSSSSSPPGGNGGSSKPPRQPPQQPPPASMPPTDGGGRAFVQGLPAGPGAKREAMILQAVRQGFVRPLEWKAVDCSRGGHTCTVYVLADAIAVGTADDWVRVSVSTLTAQMIADQLGALLPTPRICDRAWAAADTKLNPRPQPPDSKMASTARMLSYHDAVEKERAGAGGLVRPVGKSFVLINDLAGPAKLHGQTVPGSQRTAIYGWHRKNGKAIQNATDNAHVAGYTDYSHTVADLVRADCVVDGAERQLAAVYMDPELGALVSDMGPLKLTRHPGVPLGVA